MNYFYCIGISLREWPGRRRLIRGWVGSPAKPLYNIVLMSALPTRGSRPFVPALVLCHILLKAVSIAGLAVTVSVF